MNDWLNADDHAERAQHFFQIGDFEKALAEIQQALKGNPDHGDWHMGMGLTLEEMHRYGDAIASFKQALKVTPDDFNALLHLGTNHLRYQQPKQAIEAFEKLEKIDPDFEPSYCHRILAYTQLDDHEKAEQMFYLARLVEEHCPHCYQHIAQSLAMRGQLNRAIWCWQQTLKLDASFPDINANLATAYWQTKQYDLANTHFTEQIHAQPNDASSWLHWGLMLTELSRHGEAREKFLRVLTLNPIDARAHQMLGQSSLRQGHTEAAKVDLEMAKRLEPDLAGTHLALAQIAFQAGELGKARQYVQTEQSVTGQSPKQLLDLARLLIDLKKPRAVVGLLTLNTVAFTCHIELQCDALLYRGAAFMLIDNPDHGIDDFKKAHHINPKNILPSYNLALAYLEQHKFAHATVWLKKAANIKSDDPEIKHLRWKLRRALATHFLSKIKSWIMPF